jgi:hypothetical protein
MNTLLAPSTDKVGEVYQWLKSTLGTHRRVAGGEFLAALG